MINEFLKNKNPQSKKITLWTKTRETHFLSLRNYVNF